MTVRPATDMDLNGIRAIATSYGNLVNWPQRPDYLDHELHAGTLAVCADGADVVAFGAVFPREGMAHLADLFVRRDRLGAGIEKLLLAQIFPADAERLTFASKDPRTLPLYTRRHVADGAAALS